MESIAPPVGSPLPKAVPGELSTSPTLPELSLPVRVPAPQARKPTTKRLKRLELERLEVEVRERRVRTDTLEHQLLMTRMGALERFGPEDGDRALAASLVREGLLSSFTASPRPCGPACWHRGVTKRPRCEDTSELPPAKRAR